MSLKSYIDLELKPLVENEMIHHSLHWTFYPIVNQNGELIGTIEENQLFSYQVANLSTHSELIIHENLHPIECLKKMQEVDSNILFIVENGLYIGAITYYSIIHYFQDNLAYESHYAILELSIRIADYSLSELARIIESENSLILNLMTNYDIPSNKLILTLTISKNDLKNIIGILENKGYEIIHLYNETGLNSHLKERYENLMHYLAL